MQDTTTIPYIERLTKRLVANAGRTCIKFDGEKIASHEFLAKIYRYGRALENLGIQPGDVVALFAPNCPDALAIRYGANLVGAAAMFLPLASAEDVRAKLLRSIAPTLLVVFPETEACLPTDATPPVAGVGLTKGDIRLDDLAASMSDVPFESRAESKALAVIVSSGGTTGVPKGSWRSFANYSAMVSAPSPEDRRQLINGSLAYLSQVLVDITLLGGGVVVLRDHYEAADTLAAIAAERITDLFLVEPQLFELMDHPDTRTTDLSSLRSLTHVGASAPPTLRLRARERFGARIVHTYGASEEGMVSILPAAEADPAVPERFQSAGRILPFVDVRFRLSDGRIGAVGEIGSMEIRSPTVAQGYRNRSEAERAAFQDGWYCSGDLGRIDVNGYLHVYGRAADIKIIDGHMVSPTLIEETLCRLPSIRYAVVVAKPDRDLWIAVVLPWSGASADHNDCRTAVAAAHGALVAASLMFVTRDTVPLTRQGKPDREAIRAMILTKDTKTGRE